MNELATTRPLYWFERNVITEVPPPNPGFIRRVYPRFLQLAGFMTMNLGDHVLKHHKLFQHLIAGDEDSAEKTKAFYEEYRLVMHITAEFYLQTIDLVFQRQGLAKGQWVWQGEPVDPEALRQIPILAINGELDDISGVGQTRAALDLAVNVPQVDAPLLPGRRGRPLRHLQRQPLAHADCAPGPGFYTYPGWQHPVASIAGRRGAPRVPRSSGLPARDHGSSGCPQSGSAELH